MALKRKAGEWHPLFQIIGTIAFPLIYGVYLGVAESARDIAIDVAKKKQPSQHAIDLAGRMDTELRAARCPQLYAGGRAQNTPSAESINQVMMGRQLVAASRHRAVELAMELAGGAGFYRRPDWSAASAISRPPAIIRCRPVRRPNMPAPWR